MEKHELAVHLETRPFSCDVCFRGFCQKHHMERHKKHVHLKERLHKCEYCRVDFARKEHLHNHCRSKHAGQERMSCPVCGAKTESGTLVRHLLGRHEIEQGKAVEMGIWKPAENKSRGRRAKVQF
ncbi:unnamed protein product [Chondrus crispus]|uniref:C2H2-type domain-containing protein n=1 Tax=Chondrus crispus TaxID=2769 RepID=R7Q5B4_CHOCR|nr:unnamed protein product [Chondrus crispus]CDF33742.1 unnamed protein product [Chondrus crispus]|eukprot:XP_005713561.1 unnamed protein product [Chondrus crispus]